jgi:hypothetical protein
VGVNGKNPNINGEAWGLARKTEAELRAIFQRCPTAGPGVCLGPGRGPNDEWLIDIEGDGPEAEQSYLNLMGGQTVDTFGWSARRFDHHLFVVDGERLLNLLQAAGAIEGKGHESGKFTLPALPDLEFRIGGYKPDGSVKQFQSVAPPTPDDNGKPRQWNEVDTIAELPDIAFATLEAIGERDAIQRNGSASRRWPKRVVKPAVVCDAAGAREDLDRIADEFANQKPGHRHNFVRGKSNILARYVHNGWLVPEDCLEKLKAAAVTNGLADEGGLEDVEELWTSALERTRPVAPSSNGTGRENGTAGSATNYSNLSLGDFGETLADVREKPVHWLADHRLAKGKMHLTIGPGGVGKSQYVLAVAAAFTNQGQYPGGPQFNTSGKVAILAAEDGLVDTIKPRFIAAGGDPTKMFYQRTTVTTKDAQGRTVIKLALFEDLEYWNRFFDLWDPTLVSADPIQAFMGRSVRDKDNAVVRAILEPFVELLQVRGIAFIAVTHTPKKIVSDNAAYAAIDSVAYPNIARVVHVHWADPEDPDHYLITNPKLFNGRQQPTIGYKIEEHRYAVDGEDIVTSRIVCDAQPVDIHPGAVIVKGTRTPRAGIDPGKAAEWLKTRLRDGPASSLVCAIEGDQKFGKEFPGGTTDDDRIKRLGRIKWWRETILKERLGGSVRKQGFQGTWYFTLAGDSRPPTVGEVVAASTKEAAYGGVSHTP